jgi:hypothetical protein
MCLCLIFLLFKLENNLEVALESFYELSEAEKAEFNIPGEERIIDLVGDDNVGGGMIEVPMVRKQLSLIEISLLRAHWKVTSRNAL